MYGMIGILSDLEKCFAHYDRDDMVSALFATHNLFSRLASQTAEMKGYKYPKEAEQLAAVLTGFSHEGSNSRE